jgi:serine/threonine-protein kinase
VSEPLPARAVERLLEVAAGSEGAQELVGGRYRLLREIGRGGMGVVFEAEDVRLGRLVALKVLGSPAADEDLRRRFAREALSAARLNHPNIAAVYDATPEFIALELIEGGPISDVPRTDVRRMVTLLSDAARAIEYAHAQGIVHRDLKPSNLLVAGDRVCVVDFGLAKERAAESSLSVQGGLLGTPAFMAPEQTQGRLRDVDERTDVYGLGATLYACLTGRPPFESEELVELLRQVVEADPRPPGVDRDLDTIVLKCLAKERERRYPSAEGLARDLDRWLSGEPVVARPPSAADRLRRLMARRRNVIRATAAAAVLAAAATGTLLVPRILREQAARRGASEALELSALVATVLTDAEQNRRKGEMGEANRRLDEGIAACGDFLARHDLPRVRQFAARLLRARGKHEAAREELDLALRADPGLPGGHFERGLLLVDADPARALADLSAGVAPGSSLRTVDVLFGQALCALLKRDLEGAARLLEDVRALDPTHVEATLALARIALEQGDDDRALQYTLGAMNLQRSTTPER